MPATRLYQGRQVPWFFIVNCRILPGHSAREVQERLKSVIDDPKVALQYVNADGTVVDTAPSEKLTTSPGRREPLPHAPICRPTLFREEATSIRTPAAGRQP